MHKLGGTFARCIAAWLAALLWLPLIALAGPAPAAVPPVHEPALVRVGVSGEFAPYYFAGDRGHNGLFVAPGVMITKQTDVDAAIDFGADFGYKKAMSDKVSWAAAATFRTGDTYDPDSVIGGRFGFSIFWR